jgi:hypothetical protein
MPMAAARFLDEDDPSVVQKESPTYAGGRGTAFDTHTIVIAVPVIHHVDLPS